MMLGPLRVTRIVKGDVTPENDSLTIVLLHGFGAPGDDLVGLAGALDVPDGTELIFPEALHPLADFVALAGDARCWWMIDFAAMERALARGEIRDLTKEVPDGLKDAREAVVAMLDALKPKRLVLGGFSQGAMLSMDVALRDPSRKIEGLVQLSGTFLAENEWSPLIAGRAGLPVFQSHGEGDPILPFTIAEKLRHALSRGGLSVTWDPFQGPHTITPNTMRRLSSWLREL